MNSLETNKEPPVVLNEKDRELLAKTGIPPVFALLLEEKSQTFGNAFAIRTGSIFNRYLMPASPKPISVKIKTGNWGFTKGVISVDPALGKTIKKDGQWYLKKRSDHDLPKESGIIEQVVHKISLQEVLSGLHRGEYNLYGTDLGRLIIQTDAQSPVGCDILFSINLKEKEPRVERQQQIDFAKLNASHLICEPKPHWWNDEWGKFEECATHYYPAQYKHVSEEIFSDIMVYGVADLDGKILPITGDQDLLWITVPTNQHTELKDFEEVIDTFQKSGCEKIYEARIALYLKNGGNLEDAEKNISNASIARLGYVTAYESYVIDEINKAFENSGIKHLRNLVQHAPENHNHDELSPIDASMVHIWQGEITMTNNETELINFVMGFNYRKENIVQINPKWDMKKWAPVVAQQLAVQQPIPEETMTAYKEYIVTRNAAEFVDASLPRDIDNG
jgi:hypothetical protein